MKFNKNSTSTATLTNPTRFYQTLSCSDLSRNKWIWKIEGTKYYRIETKLGNKTSRINLWWFKWFPIVNVHICVDQRRGCIYPIASSICERKLSKLSFSLYVFVNQSFLLHFMFFNYCKIFNQRSFTFHKLFLYWKEKSFFWENLNY